MKSQKALLRENAELRQRLSEAEELLAAIKSGSVDAFITDDQKVFTLTGADQAYRVFVETMNEGAATLTSDGTVMYCNQRLAAMLMVSADEIMGRSMLGFVRPVDWRRFKKLLKQGSGAIDDIALNRTDGQQLSVHVSSTPLKLESSLLCLVFSDISQLKAAQCELEENNQALERKVRERTSLLRGANKTLERHVRELGAVNKKLARSNEQLRKETEERRKVEQALLRNQDRISHMMQTPVISIGFGDDSGKIFEANDTFFQLTGYTREDLASGEIDWVKLTAPEYAELDRQCMKELERQGMFGPYEKEYIRKDGSRVPIMLSAARLGGRADEHVAFILDITARKRAEDERRQSDRLYRAIGESIDYGVWICAPDGRNIYASDSFLKLVGLTQEQCSNFGWGDVLHPEDAERTIAQWKECVQTGGTWDIEHRFRGVDGKWHDVLARGIPVRDERGEITLWAGINLDISEMKRTEQALRASEERFRSLFEKMTEGFALHEIVCDREGEPCDYRFLEINPAFERLTGLKREDVIGKTVGQLLPNEGPKWVQIYGPVALGGPPVHFDDYSPTFGRHYDVYTFSPARGQFAVLFTDVSETKRVQEQIEHMASFPQLNPSPILELDAQGTITYHNDSALRFLELAGSGKDLRAFLPADIDKIIESLKREEGGESFLREITIGERTFSETIYLSKRLNVVRIYATDVTERKHAEEKIEAAMLEAVNEKNRLEALMKALPVGVCMVDCQGGNIRENEMFTQVWGGSHPPTQSVDDYAAYQAWWMETGMPVQPEQWASAQVLVKGESVIGQTMRIQQFNGSLTYVINSAAPILNAKGELVGSAVAIMDITSRIEAENKVLRQNEILAGINRIFREVMGSLSEGDLGKVCLDVAAEVTRSKFGFFGEIGPDNLLHDIAVSNPGWEACAITGATGAPRSPESFPLRGLYGRVMLDGKSLFTNSPLTHPDCRGLPDGHPPLESFLGVPFTQDGRTTGMIAVANREGGYTQEDVEALEALAVAIQQAILRKRAEEALRQARDELEMRVRERTGELKLAVAALQTERKRFSDVLNALPAYVVLISTDYRVPFANLYFEERFGKSDGKRCYEYLFGRAEPCEICESFCVLKTKSPHHWEWTGPDNRIYDITDFPFAEADGSEMILEMGIDVTERKLAERELQQYRQNLEGLVAQRTAQWEAANALLHAEITERKHVEESLRTTRDFLDNLLNYANAPILVWNSAGRITRFNHAFERLTGRVAEEVIGGTLDILFPEETREESMGYLHSAEAGERLEAVELPVLHKDGSVRVVLWNSSTLYDPARQTPAATIAQGQDITLRKQAEEALQQKSMELVRSNADLEQFAYIASHDLQEPLRMVASYVQLLGKRYQGKLDKDADDFIHFAADGALRMQRMINDLLAYSRVSSRGKSLEETRLETVLARALENLKMAIRDKGATVTHDPLPAVLGDEGQLVQIFQNLIDNALKFQGDHAPMIHISAKHQGEECVCSIRDNGIGVAPDQVGRLFALFVRLHTQREYPGTGIGLAICRRIIERHGGRIWLESTPGQGSTFYFSLAAAPGKEER